MNLLCGKSVPDRVSGCRKPRDSTSGMGSSWLATDRLASRLIALCLGFAIVCVPGHLPAQSGESLDDAKWKRGFHGLGMLLRGAGLQVHSERATWEQYPAAERMLILLGPNPARWLSLARRGGGCATWIACDQRYQLTYNEFGIAFGRGPVSVRRQEDGYRGFEECPLIRRFGDHPTTAGLQQLVANRAATVVDLVIDPRRKRTVMLLPPVQGRQFYLAPPKLAVAWEHDDRRAFFLADPSLLTNQMIVLGDNARFAAQTINWLKANQVQHVLIVHQDTVLNPLDPNLVELQLPPPDPRDVINAMRQLPPELLLDFGNSVVTSVEDQGVLNDLIGHLFGLIPKQLYLRILLLVVTWGVGLIAFYRLFGGNRETLLTSQALRQAPAANASGAHERFTAATRLMDSLLTRLEAARWEAASVEDVGDVPGIGWSELIGKTRLIGNPSQTWKLRKSLKRYVRKLTLSPQWWTPRRLEQLDRFVQHCERQLDSGRLRVAS